MYVIIRLTTYITNHYPCAASSVSSPLQASAALVCRRGRRPLLQLRLKNAALPGQLLFKAQSVSAHADSDHALRQLLAKACSWSSNACASCSVNRT